MRAALLLAVALVVAGCYFEARTTAVPVPIASASATSRPVTPRPSAPSTPTAAPTFPRPNLSELTHTERGCFDTFQDNAGHALEGVRIEYGLTVTSPITDRDLWIFIRSTDPVDTKPTLLATNWGVDDFQALGEKGIVIKAPTILKGDTKDLKWSLVMQTEVDVHTEVFLARHAGRGQTEDDFTETAVGAWDPSTSVSVC